MDFDTLIYVFFIIASIIFSLYKNIKKSQRKREQSGSLPDLVEHKTPVDSVFSPHEISAEENPFTMEDSKPEERLEESEYETYETLEETSLNDPPLESSESLEEPVPEPVSLESTDSDFKSKTQEKKSSIHDGAYKIDDDEDSEFGFEFDATMAIIYSEILKRPEY